MSVEMRKAREFTCDVCGKRKKAEDMPMNIPLGDVRYNLPEGWIHSGVMEGARNMEGVIYALGHRGVDFCSGKCFLQVIEESFGEE